MKISVINGIVVAYKDGHHQILQDAAVLIENDLIAGIYEGEAAKELHVDEVIDARGMLVCPGFINIHTHGTIQSEGIYTLDWARRDLYSYNFLATQPYAGQRPGITEEEARILSLNFLVKVLKTGSTTVMEMGGVGTTPDIFAQTAGEIGIRAYTARGYRSAEYSFDTNGHLGYIWDEEKGRRDFQAGLAHIKKYHNTYGSRIKAFVEPRNADTCTPDLLKDSIAAARDLDVPVQIHTAQSLFEFREIVQRHGKTPVQFLNDLGFLGPSTILGHCVFTSGHSDTAWPGNDDQLIMADTGTSVGHSPTIFMRDGRAFESFDRHRRLGVNVAVGTDVFPEDIIREMGMVSNMSKLVEKDYKAGTAWQVFEATTLGGAKALNRPDLGRLASGAKADVVLVDLANILVGPFADPIKILVHVASGRDVDTVIVDGKVVVKNKRLMTMSVDELELLVQGQRIAQRIWEESDWPFKNELQD